MARRFSVDRRRFIGLAGSGVVASTMLAGCGKSASEPAPSPAPEPAPPRPPASSTIVRVASVKTAVEGNVLPELIKRFELATAFRVEVTTGTRVYELARGGKVDAVISHYGHKDAEQFVLDGLGEWPRTIFSNQMAMVGPPSDPAKIRGLSDAVEGFRRIAATRSKFVVNDIDGVRYLTDILWHAAGKPDRTGWLLDGKGAKDGAITRASELGAYSLWGLTPFLRLGGAKPLALEPLLVDDPLLQRMLVSIVVKPHGSHAINVDGAHALQAFLLAPETQAAIRTIHYPGKAVVSWAPAGRHNRTAILPRG